MTLIHRCDRCGALIEGREQYVWVMVELRRSEPPIAPFERDLCMACADTLEGIMLRGSGL